MTLGFFLAAFGITWALQLPAVLAKLGFIDGPVERFMSGVGLGAFGPLLAAVLLSAIETRGAGVRELFARVRIWRVGWRWYAIALGLCGATYVVGAGAWALAGGAAIPWFYPPVGAPRIAAMIVFPIGEEPGWRGFALPRLQERFGPLGAALLLGLGWGLWHVPMFYLADLSPGLFLVSFVNLLAGSIAFSWIYNHTRGSLLLAVLAHMGAHLCNPAQALPGNAVPFEVFTVAMCVAAVALVLIDRAAWRVAPTGT